MKQFLKIFFASLLAFIIGLVLFFFIAIGIISLMISSGINKETVISENSILKINFSQPLNERSSNNPFDLIDLNNFAAKKQPGLNDILKCIDKASSDQKIKGIYIDLPTIQGGMAMIEELRNALLKFKKTGKFIYSYAENYSQGAYYLASVSDKVYLNPQGTIELHGLMTQLMFFKGTLEKLEIEPELIRHGKYKSAGETFIKDKMSDENKSQIAAMVDNIWNNIAKQISSSRSLSISEVKNIGDSLLVRNAADAIHFKLADKLAYEDEFIAELNKKVGMEQNDKPNFVSLNKYVDAPNPAKKKYTGDRIAVIYATGEIQSGEGSGDEVMGADKISAAIKKARNDEKIKAIVLRVNSPGGSSLASEIIWREATLAAKAKPLVVSMSDVAASGGYYISCGARKIVAQPNTITGSIGVFGLLFNAQNMLKNKLGITLDVYKTGLYTDLGLPLRALTSSEEKIIQEQVDQIYLTFTQRVSDGRKIPITEVDSLGQGRIWTGDDALKNHLVDTLGGLNDAINIASKMAGINNYRINEYPEQKQAVQQLMEDLSESTKVWFERQELGEHAVYLKSLRSVLRSAGIQARMEYEIIFN